MGVLASSNLEITKSKQSHYRIRSNANGKFLIFGTGNLILAGRRTHAAACLSSNKLIYLLARELKRPIFAVSHQSPNSVITGQLNCTISDTIKKSIQVNYSDKFPGIALQIKTPGVTPELYLRKSMVIFPGIVSSNQLIQVIQEVEEMLTPYIVAPNG